MKDGDGHGLEPFRRRQLFSRSLLQLRLPQGDGRELDYTVDVRHGGDREDGEVRAHLYLDGRHHAQSTLPATLPVVGGHIEVTMGVFGIRRCHYVTKDGAEQQLTPDPRTAEGRRARLDRERPVLGRCVGFLSVLILAVGLGLIVPQVLEPVSENPPFDKVTGAFESPVALPLWLDITVVLGAVVAATERTLRLRHL